MAIIDTMKDYEPKLSEVKLWTVTVGNFDPLQSASRKAMKFVSKLDGLAGIHPQYPYGTFLCFYTQEQAVKARETLQNNGIKCGNNICTCCAEKKYLKKESKK